MAAVDAELETFWGQCGAAAYFDGFLLVFGFVGAVSRHSAWVVLLITAFCTVLGLMFGCFCASNKKASQTEESWKVARVREVLGCFLVTIISAGLVWVWMQSAGPDSHVQHMRVTEVFPDGSLQLSWPEWETEMTLESFEPTVKELLTEGTTVTFRDSPDETMDLVIGGLRYDSDELFAKAYGDSYLVIHLHANTVARSPEDALRITRASNVYLRMENEDLGEARMVFVQASTAQFINFIDFMLDLMATCMLPLPALIVGKMQDKALDNCVSIKKMAGLRLSLIVITWTTFHALWYASMGTTGCSGGCWLFLSIFIILVATGTCFFASFWVNFKKYPGVLTKHDGFDLCSPWQSTSEACS